MVYVSICHGPPFRKYLLVIEIAPKTNSIHPYPP
jgi:hypothetical protein